ncbi:unnamed protein product [Peronospora destructor]|uniref:Rhodanese domain-containing protein n=1 Tax=Peronospora destructor TaxID=86335 RepID=A0AAV0VDR1_9STRA|nr:unnamed protein product [Peronospora destructor]
MLLRCLQPLHCPFRRWVSTQSDCLESRQYVSLYNYVALDKSELPKLRRRLPRGWKALGVSGRIYLSPERINGQLILPQYHVTTLSTSFPTVLIRQTMFYGHLQSSTDTDEHHSRLTVKIWKQLMHDGFQGGELNVQNSGRSLPPEQWHHKLKVRNDSQDSNILVLDVRNFYEHEIGRFDGATRIMVDTFRDTSSVKKAAARARTRSVSVDVDTKTDDGNVKEVMSLFKGKNFVFDQRCVGDLTESEEVTGDVLGQCFQCGEPCNHHTNCSNVMCHGLILQCLNCARIRLGACSKACKQESISMKAMTTQQQQRYRQEQATCWMPAIPNALSKYVSKRPQAPLARKSHTRHFTASNFLYKLIDYCELQTAYVYGQSSSLADEALLRDLRVQTTRKWPKAEQVIDEIQGKFLSFLVQTTKAQRALEIGCFTGYSALCIANGLAADGSLVTCDIDSAAMQFAQSFFDKSSHADQITAVNQDGLEYLNTAALSISAKQQPFDLIFVDANKCKYRAYYDFILEHKVLHPSGLLVFDNTLFRGRVAACAHGLTSNKERIAHSLADFNHYVAQDVRTTQVIVPLWDGLTLIQYNDTGNDRN